MPVKCAFCPKPADSGEHIWDAWICELAPFKGKGIFNEQMTPAQPVRSWKSAGMHRKKKTVCTTCNNEWMSDVVNDRAKPCTKDMILSDGPVELDLSCIVSISIFSFLKSVITDHAPEGQKPFFSIAQRYEFRRSLSLPRIQVWIGCLAQDISYRSVCRMKYGFWNPRPKVGIGYRLYAFTWGVGRFFLQMLAFRSKSTSFRRAPVPLINQTPFWDQYAIPIWPAIGNTVLWPPPKHLGDSLINQFTNRFTP